MTTPQDVDNMRSYELRKLLDSHKVAYDDVQSVDGLKRLVLEKVVNTAPPRESRVMPKERDVDSMGAQALRRMLKMHSVDVSGAKDDINKLRELARPLLTAWGSTPVPRWDSVASDSWESRRAKEQPTDMPIGWILVHDEDGDDMFVNLNEEPPLETYDDPRVSFQFRRRPAVMRAPPVPPRRGPPAIKRQKSTDDFKGEWKVFPLDANAFKRLPWKLPPKSSLPPYARGQPVPNRYHDILPTMRTRVKLHAIKGDETTDYINANHVNGEKEWGINYIAAQGPTPETIKDFIRMVWEQKVQVIVMLTKLVEAGKKKCAQYWPDKNMKSMIVTVPDLGDFTIAHMSEVRKDYFLVTELILSFRGERRHLIHYWFDTWPDHGVPRKNGLLDTDGVLTLLDEFKSYSKKHAPDAPILIHCSAGIGRTGTVIGIDASCSEVSKTGKVNVVMVVNRLREDRGGLVQHAAQLSYLHVAVESFVSSHNTEGGSQASASKAVPDGPGKVDPRLGHIEINGHKYRFVDFDGDGEMSLDEAKKQGMPEDVFMAIDADKNGTITKKEFRDYVMMQLKLKQFQAKSAAVKLRQKKEKANSWRQSFLHGELSMGTVLFQGKEFLFVDIDGDGEMTLEEAKTQGMTEDLFRLLDADGNGRVTKEEFRQFQQEQQGNPFYN